MTEKFKFLDGLDEDMKVATMTMLRDLWTHSSTAHEGNSLTLGETAFVIEEGLTVSGKPLKDHQEVVGHAKAIDVVYDLAYSGKKAGKEDLFLLHKSVLSEKVCDIYKPLGAFKNTVNGAMMNTKDGSLYFEFAYPEDVPLMMDRWLKLLNGTMTKSPLSGKQALEKYCELFVSFIGIHPFFDGNGRLGRLVANLPLILSGYPPIIIDRNDRKEYITVLTEYHLKKGRLTKEGSLFDKNAEFSKFAVFCRKDWGLSLDIVRKMRKQQADRDLARGHSHPGSR